MSEKRWVFVYNANNKNNKDVKMCTSHDALSNLNQVIEYLSCAHPYIPTQNVSVCARHSRFINYVAQSL